MEAERLIALSLGKMHCSPRGGLSLHRSLLVSYVLRSAQRAYFDEEPRLVAAQRAHAALFSQQPQQQQPPLPPPQLSPPLPPTPPPPPESGDGSDAETLSAVAAIAATLCGSYHHLHPPHSVPRGALDESGRDVSGTPPAGRGSKGGYVTVGGHDAEAGTWAGAVDDDGGGGGEGCGDCDGDVEEEEAEIASECSVVWDLDANVVAATRQQRGAARRKRRNCCPMRTRRTRPAPSAQDGGEEVEDAAGVGDVEAGLREEQQQRRGGGADAVEDEDENEESGAKRPRRSAGEATTTAAAALTGLESGLAGLCAAPARTSGGGGALDAAWQTPIAAF